MSVTIKRPEELELMRGAGKILAKVHEQLGNELRPGMSTYEIDRIGEEMIRSFGCEPSFKNYCGYPASVCVSIDEEVVHGIPCKEKFIQEGDIVSLDIGVIHKGYHSDAARTHAVGEISKEAELLIERTRQSFFEGMKYAAAGRHLYEISGAIGSYAESFGYGVVNVKNTSMEKKLMEYQAKEESLIRQVENEQKRAAELEERRVYVQTKQYIEEVAKQKLGLVKPDEILLKPRPKDN